MARTTRKEFAIEVAQEAIKMYEQNQEEKVKKTILRNTRALLKQYHELKMHCNNYESGEAMIIDECEDKQEEEFQEDLIIKSITRTKSRTYVMVKHIDTCLEVLQKNTSANKSMEKYEVIKVLYLNQSTCKIPWAERMQEAADSIKVNERTVRRYELDMVNELSVLLFGIGAANLVK